MKFPLVDTFKLQFDSISEDARYKGYPRVIAERFCEFIYKRRFKKMGVFHPENSDSHSFINQQSLHKDANANQPSCYYVIKKALRKLKIEFDKICLLDIGCGSGRLLSIGMLLKFEKVYGVDLDESAIQIARKNCIKLREKGHRTSFDIALKDATQHDIPPHINVVYLFNPFGEKTIKSVLDKIVQHCRQRAKTVYIIYVNPVFHEVFESSQDCIKVFDSFFKNGKRDLSIFQVKVSGQDFSSSSFNC
jgi:predicted RNA methylase